MKSETKVTSISSQRTCEVRWVFYLGAYSVLLLVVGAFAGGALTYLSAGQPALRSSRSLVERWRTIKPGEHIDEAIERIARGPGIRHDLSDPATMLMIEASSEEYAETHGAVLFVLGTIDPHVLMIFFDDQNQVTFVTSHPT